MSGYSGGFRAVTRVTTLLVTPSLNGACLYFNRLYVSLLIYYIFHMLIAYSAYLSTTKL